MRQARLKAPSHLPEAYYHCVSRVVNRAFVLGEPEREAFVRFMRKYEIFCGVRIVTFAVLSNHFHILLEVPKRPDPDQLPSDEDLLERVRILNGKSVANDLRQRLDILRASNTEDAQNALAALRETYFRRMWDVSAFMKALKQRFSVWFNRQHNRVGTLWEERFKSVLVEGAGEALAAMAAYIDLNPVRAGIVEDPKDYRWCGYAETVAGQKAAREGLAIVVRYLVNQNFVHADAILARYRVTLFDRGEAKGLDEDGNPLRRGFTPEAIEEVRASGGRLSRYELLRCRVRYFSDGAALGGKEFINSVFTVNRPLFGPTRKDGARPVREAAVSLFTLHGLKLRTIT